MVIVIQISQKVLPPDIQIQIQIQIQIDNGSLLVCISDFKWNDVNDVRHWIGASYIASYHTKSEKNTSHGLQERLVSQYMAQNIVNARNINDY